MDTPSSNVKRTQKRTKVSVAGVAKGQFQREGLLSAELRQKVLTTSEYPAIQISNDKQDNIFAIDEFNTKPQVFTNEEMRVCWIDVPAGTTMEQVAERMAKFPSATLYRVLSNSPILTSGHKNAIARGLLTMDTIADSQVLRYPNGDRQGRDGQIILDSEGRVQYRKIFFKAEKHEDEDLRGETPEYRSAAIKAELAGNTAAAGTVVEAGQVVVTQDEWQE